MVRSNYIVVLIVLSFSFINLNAQNYFYKTYNGGLYDVGQGVCELPDEHYAVTGSTSSIEGSSQVFIMVLDSLGNQIWTKGYGGDGINWGRRIFHRENEGFWVMGYSTSYGNGDYDFVIWKIDEDGELEWQQNYGTIGWDRLWDAVELDNGDFILVGETEGTNSQGKDVYMLRIDDQGNEVWETQLANEGDDIAYAVTSYDDTTVIVVGEYFDDNENVGLLLNMHIDGSINEQWTYNEEGPTTFLDVDVWDEEIYVCGGVERNNNSYVNSALIRLDIDLNIVDTDFSNWLEDDFASNILVVDNNRLYWSMWSISPDHNVFSGGPDVFILKFHRQLYFLGTSVPHAGVDPDEFHQMIPTSDGGFISVGFCSDNRVVSSSGFNVMVSKFGPNDEFQTVSDENEDFLYVNNIEDDSSLKIYPNPTNDFITIDMDYERVDVFDATGKILNDNITSGVIDLSKYEKGVYFLKISRNNRTYVRKVIRN